MTNPKATQRQIAEKLGVSPPVVHDLFRKGIISKDDDLDTAVRKAYLHSRETAAGRQGKDEKYNLVDQRARLAARQSEKTEMELAKLREELWPISAIAEVLEFDHTSTKTNLLGIPSAYKSLCPELTAKQIDILDSLIREKLNERARDRLPPGIRRMVQRYFEELHAAAEADSEPMGRPVSVHKPRNSSARKMADKPNALP